MRAASFEALEALQASIRARLGEKALLIHDRIKGDSPATLQFHNVAAAIAHGETVRFWLHQSKLLEGVDDSTFVAIGILDSFANTRALVQQIGRAIRSSDITRRTKQSATVVSAPEAREEIRGRWERYLSYEQLPRSDLKGFIQAEGALPDRLLELLPAFQYVEGDFRSKYLMTGRILAGDLKVSLRTSVFVVDPDFDMREAEAELDEALLSQDRFVPRPIDGLANGMFGRTYYSWRNSPYLTAQYLSEWALGLCVAVRIGSYLFVQDTGGICFDPRKLRVRKADRGTLLKAFPDAKDGATTLTRVSGNSLDMSDRAVRAQAFRTSSLEATFTDLADSALVLSSAYGYVKGIGRYLGLRRARLSDASDGMVTLLAFKTWLEELEATLGSTVQRHPVFDRYADVTSVEEEEAKPVSILLDFSSESFQEFLIEGEADDGTLGHDLPYDDLCADVSAGGSFTLQMRDGKQVACTVSYRPKTHRYRVHSPQLDQLIVLRRSGTAKSRTITELINRDQSFRLLVAKQQVVYALGEFYTTRDLVSPTGVVLALEDSHVVPALSATTSEKGDSLYASRRDEWMTKSVFGLVHALCANSGSQREDELAREIGSLDTVLLDDGPNELGDFIGLDRARKRVVVVHAKASRALHRDAVSELQIVGRQVIASLAFCSTQARVAAVSPTRWERPVTANKTRFVGLSRVFKSPGGESLAETAGHVLGALSNPSYNREIWIVAGRLLDISHVRASAANSAQLSNRTRQLLMFLAGLQTSCQRANARLRIFAH